MLFLLGKDCVIEGIDPIDQEDKRPDSTDLVDLFLAEGETFRCIPCINPSLHPSPDSTRRFPSKQSDKDEMSDQEE